VVTVRKKGMLSGKSKAVVDKCWGIADIAVVDMKNSPGIINNFCFSLESLKNCHFRYYNRFY